MMQHKRIAKMSNWTSSTNNASNSSKDSYKIFEKRDEAIKATKKDNSLRIFARQIEHMNPKTEEWSKFMRYCVARHSYLPHLIYQTGFPTKCNYAMVGNAQSIVYVYADIEWTCTGEPTEEESTQIPEFISKAVATLVNVVTNGEQQQQHGQPVYWYSVNASRWVEQPSVVDGASLSGKFKYSFHIHTSLECTLGILAAQALLHCAEMTKHNMDRSVYRQYNCLRLPKTNYSRSHGGEDGALRTHLSGIYHNGKTVIGKWSKLSPFPMDESEVKSREWQYAMLLVPPSTSITRNFYDLPVKGVPKLSRQTKKRPRVENEEEEKEGKHTVGIGGGIAETMSSTNSEITNVISLIRQMHEKLATAQFRYTTSIDNNVRGKLHPIGKTPFCLYKNDFHHDSECVCYIKTFRGWQAVCLNKSCEQKGEGGTTIYISQ